MLLGETASTIPMDGSQDGSDFAADKTATAPRASALSTIMASNVVLVSRCTASCAVVDCATSMSRVFRTSPAKSMIAWSRENSNACKAMVAGLYNVRREVASYRSGGRVQRRVRPTHDPDPTRLSSWRLLSPREAERT